MSAICRRHHPHGKAARQPLLRANKSNNTQGSEEDYSAASPPILEKSFSTAITNLSVDGIRAPFPAQPQAFLRHLRALATLSLAPFG